MDEYIITAEVKLIVSADDELDARNKCETSMSWNTNNCIIKDVNKLDNDKQKIANLGFSGCYYGNGRRAW